MDIWLELILLVVLTATNAFFTGSEIAFVSLREGQLQRLEEEESKAAKRMVELASRPSQFLAACQVGITLAGFLASATAAVRLATPVRHALGFLGGGAEVVSVLLVTLVLAYFTLVFGELAPKRIAMQRAEGWARRAVSILQFVSQMARPAIWLLERSTNVIVRLAGADPHLNREEVTGEEIRNLLEAQESFTPEQRSIIAGAFEVGDRTLREILTPRGSVVGIANSMSAADALGELARAGHSRAPVHTGDLDDVIGIVHVRDLIDGNGNASDHVRPALVLPESLSVPDALRRLQSTRQQMAIVVNEHGGVEGVITVEDLLEEIVGEIYDEFDRDVTNIVKNDDGSYLLPGSFPIHDLPDLDIELPDGQYATVAGYVLDQLGHIPVAGESTTADGWKVSVLEVVDRAITRVKITPAPATTVE